MGPKVLCWHETVGHNLEAGPDLGLPAPFLVFSLGIGSKEGWSFRK